MESNLAFLLGNIDEHGNLESESDLAKDLQGADLEFLNKQISGAFGDLIKDVPSSTLATEKDRILPQKDAIDFYEDNDLAEDDQDSQPAPITQVFVPMLLQDAHFEQKDTDSIEKVLKELFPSFQKESFIRFTELFTPRSKTFKKPIKTKEPTAVKDKGYSLSSDTRDEFYTPSTFVEIPDYLYEVQRIENKNKPKSKQPTIETTDESSFLPIVTDSWEKRIVWDEPAPIEPKLKIMVRNQDLEMVDWTDAIIWDDHMTYNGPVLEANDPTILPVDRKVEKTESTLDKFNISDDLNYEVFKNRHGRQRQNQGPIRLQHSLPAIKLQYPYFKYQMTIHELRSFHRPLLKSLESLITFTKLKNAKYKKKDLKGRDPSELMRTAKDLTLRDTCKFALVEYSEENPPILMNTGMATLFYNYYRKVDEKDAYIPQLPYGSPFVLEQIDASPFFGFGDIGKGQTITCMYNNMFRAPLFKHPVQQTDFLIIRYRANLKSPSKYYIREIPFLFTAGQTLPAMEVPKPQARKVTAAMKTKLQVTAFRLMRQDPLRRLKLEKLVKLFPEYTEGQIRQKVKEFCSFQRKGISGSYWKLKPGVSLPSEEELRKLLGPEMACIYESMLVGEQWLRDAGYAASLDYGIDEDEDKVDLEVQLAPWTITHNFLMASQGKCMLKLYGPGDPTGIGEGFSFIKTSMREMFVRAGETPDENAGPIDPRKASHKYSILKQQEAYKEEIERIWNDQFRSLSAAQEPFWQDEQPTVDKDVATASDTDMEDSKSISSLSSHLKGNKVLVINRLIRNEQGELVWKSESVSDQKVMTAYLKQRASIEKEMNEMTDEQDERKKKKKSTMEHLKKYVKQKVEEKPQQEKSSFTLTLKIPMQAGKTLEQSKEETKRKREILFGEKKKKKKKKPLAELNRILDRILDHLMEQPDSFAFCKPVNPNLVLDYYQIVKNPKTLEEIKKQIKELGYQHSNEFMADLKLVESNCHLYNGPHHPLSSIVSRLVADAQALLSTSMIEIKGLEREIAEKSRTLSLPAEPDSTLIDEAFDQLL